MPLSPLKSVLIACSLSMLLTNCASTTSSVPVCAVQIVPYSDAFQDAAAMQLATLTKGSPVAVLVNDYGTERKRLEAACGGH